jgi:hypothetical protein
MSWLSELHQTQPLAHGIGALAFSNIACATACLITTVLRIPSAQVLAIVRFR